MKISSILRDLLASSADRAEFEDAVWADDPYAHPAINAMSERERADLPPVHPVVRPATLGGSPSRIAGARIACA